MTDVPYINPILPESDYDGSEYDEKSGIALAYKTDDKENLLDLDEYTDLDEYIHDEQSGKYYTTMYPLGEGLKEASAFSRKKKRYFQLRIQSIREGGERACELVWFPIKDDTTHYEPEDIIGEMLLEKVEQDKSNPNRLIFHGKKLDVLGDANKTQTTRAVTFLRNDPLKTAENINTIIDNCNFIDKTNIEKSLLGSKIPLAEKITGGRTTRRRKHINRKKFANKSRRKIIKRKRKTPRKASKKSKRRGRKSRKR